MSIARNIFKHAAIYSGANALGKMVGFILLPFYAHIFDTEGYGVIGMVDGSVGLLSILFGAASHNAVMRIYYAEKRHADVQRAVISTSIRMIWLISSVLVIIPLIFSRALSDLLLANAGYQNAIILSLLTFVFSMGNSGAETYLVIEQRSVAYSLVGLFRMVFGIGMNIILVFILKIGVIGIFLSSFLTAVISGVIVHWLAIRNTGFSYEPKIAREILAMWLPLMPGEFFDYVGRQAERFFVRFMINLEGVGILEMAYKFPPLLGYFISQPFLRAWRTKSFDISGDEDAPLVMGKMFTNMLFLMIAAGLMLIVTIDEVLMLLTPESFWRAANIARIETVTTVIAAANSYFLFGLLHANLPGKITLIKSTMAVLKIALSGIFILYAGLGGAALSALIVQSLTLIWIYQASQSHYRVVLEYGKIISIVSVAIGMGLLIEYAQRTNHLIGYDLVSAAVAGTLDFAVRDSHKLGVWAGKIPVLADFLIEAALASLFGVGVFLLRPGLARSLIRRSSTKVSEESRA